MTPKEQAFVNAIAAQRDQAMNLICNLQAEIFERDEKIKSLEEKLPKLDTTVA